jgi:hypothetical protein
MDWAAFWAIFSQAHLVALDADEAGAKDVNSFLN